MSEETDVRHCRKPWQMLYVHLNGDVKPCCYATFPVASLRTRGTKLSEVWAGEIMTEVRASIERNEIHRICAGAGCAYVRSRFSEKPAVAADAASDEPSERGVLSHAVQWVKGRWSGVSVAEPPPPPAPTAGIPEGMIDRHTQQLAQLGQRRASFHVALKFRAAGDEHSARHWMRKSADDGEEYAQYWLGAQMLAPGAEHDPKLAVQYLAKAAEAGFVQAITLLGNCYRNGIGAPRDPARAVELFRQAADFGDPAAWRYLAGCYRRGEGVAMDAKEADRLDAIALRREKSVEEPAAVPG